MGGYNWRPATQGAMGGHNRRPETQVESSGIDNDWRNQLTPDARRRINNKIIKTLEKSFPVTGLEGLVELQKIAVRFEEKIYTAATSQSDYLQKISMKMLSLENKSRTYASLPNVIPNPPDQVSMGGCSWRLATQRESGGIDWHNELTPDARKKIINKIMEKIKKHLLIAGPDELVELQKIAARFEEKIYSAAASQSDYLRKICIKMHTLENKSHPGATYTLPPNVNPNPSDQGNNLQSELSH